MKFGFVTCVQLGLECLEAIYDAGGKVDLVVTLREDVARDKAGRIYLDDFCQKRDVKLLKIRNINVEKVRREIIEAEIDWLFIIGWSQIAKKELLGAPRKGVLGMHPTLLPQGRGRAPIPWAIIKGLKKTGVTLFKLDEGVDTGPILKQKEIVIHERETAETLYEKARHAHGELIREIWLDLVGDRVRLTEQDDSRASVWPGRRPEDGELVFDMTVEQVDRLVRAVTHPYPGSFIAAPVGIIRIWSGEPAPTGPEKESYDVDTKGMLRLKLSDGFFVSDKWGIEASE